MEILKKSLEKLIETLPIDDKEKLKNRLNDLMSVYPFNEYEYIISALLGLKKIKLDDYLEIRDEYIARNMYLFLFEISAPRTFGEQWAQGHLNELVPKLIKPTKKIESNYSGEYDFLYKSNKKEIIKIEVKASRAVDSNSQESIYIKALSKKSKKSFDMNFQQIKPKCCDVLVWIGVWRDVIRYWVLSSSEVENSKYYSGGQHRGNDGEGQLHLKDDNIDEFNSFEVKSNKLEQAIQKAFERQNSK